MKAQTKGKAISFLDYLDMQSGVNILSKSRNSPNTSPSRNPKIPSKIENKIDSYLKTLANTQKKPHHSTLMNNANLNTSRDSIKSKRSVSKPNKACPTNYQPKEKLLTSTRKIKSFSINAKWPNKNDHLEMGHSHFGSLDNSIHDDYQSKTRDISFSDCSRNQTGTYMRAENSFKAFNRKSTEKKKWLPLECNGKTDKEKSPNRPYSKNTKHLVELKATTFNFRNQKVDSEFSSSIKSSNIYDIIKRRNFSEIQKMENHSLREYLMKLSNDFYINKDFFKVIKFEDKKILLPSKKDKSTPTIFVDLFNTLVKCKLKPETNGTFKLLVKQRPHLELFLREISSRAELVVFSSSNAMLIDQVLDQIDPDRILFQSVLTKEHCTLLQGM
jgi:hypothetical protein